MKGCSRKESGRQGGAASARNALAHSATVCGAALDIAPAPGLRALDGAACSELHAERSTGRAQETERVMKERGCFSPWKPVAVMDEAVGRGGVCEMGR